LAAGLRAGAFGAAFATDLVVFGAALAAAGFGLGVLAGLAAGFAVFGFVALLPSDALGVRAMAASSRFADFIT
jgi:hypothetical protein